MTTHIHYFMKKFRLIISLLGLFIGGGIVLVSLSSASASQAYSQENFSHRKLYWGEEILPDNLFYPVIAMADKARLEMSLPTERIYLQINYSHRRLGYAKELLIKGQKDLAQSTLTKSQKYLNYAAQAILECEVEDEVKLHLLSSIDFHLGEVNSMMDSFLPSQKEPIEKLIQETLTFRDLLQRDLEIE